MTDVTSSRCRICPAWGRHSLSSVLLSGLKLHRLYDVARQVCHPPPKGLLERGVLCSLRSASAEVTDDGVEAMPLDELIGQPERESIEGTGVDVSSVFEKTSRVTESNDIEG